MQFTFIPLFLLQVTKVAVYDTHHAFIAQGCYKRRDGLQSAQWYHDSECIPVYRYTGIQVLQIVCTGLQVGIQVYRSTGSLQKVYRLIFGVGIVECSIFLRMYQLASIVSHAQNSTTLLGSPDSSCIDVLVRGENNKTRPLSQFCNCGHKFLLKLWHHKTS